jgi:hypothetical protein
MSPQKVNNHIIMDLVRSKVDEFSVTEVRRKIIKCLMSSKGIYKTTQ